MDPDQPGPLPERVTTSASANKEKFQPSSFAELERQNAAYWNDSLEPAADFDFEEISRISHVRHLGALTFQSPLFAGEPDPEGRFKTSGPSASASEPQRSASSLCSCVPFQIVCTEKLKIERLLIQ